MPSPSPPTWRAADILLGGNPEALAKVEVGDWSVATETQEDYDRRLKDATTKYIDKCTEDKQRVLELGGLHVLGTERHESRRIDNQLRGRAGRQGDPGSSRFYLSLEDDLLRIFGSDRMKGMMERLGMEDGIPLEHPWLSKAVGNAQSKVEGRNFGIRKSLLEYDEVNSQQRDAVYGIRNRVIRGEDSHEMVLDYASSIVHDFCSEKLPAQGGEDEMDVDGLNRILSDQFKMDFTITMDDALAKPADEIIAGVMEQIAAWYSSKEDLIGEENLRYRERYFLLSVTDELWKDHLQAMDHLRGGIGLRGYGQRNPLLEYKKEGFEMFQMMRDLREQNVIERLFQNLSQERALTDEEKKALLAEQRRKEQERAAQAMTRANKLGGGRRGPVAKPVTVRRDGNKVGRNDPCPCGSGKKYKKCHMGKDLEEAPSQAPA